jgi:hypothetical protein
MPYTWIITVYHHRSQHAHSRFSLQYMCLGTYVLCGRLSIGAQAELLRPLYWHPSVHYLGLHMLWSHNGIFNVVLYAAVMDSTIRLGRSGLMGHVSIATQKRWLYYVSYNHKKLNAGMLTSNETTRHKLRIHLSWKTWSSRLNRFMPAQFVDVMRNSSKSGRFSPWLDDSYLLLNCVLRYLAWISVRW